MKGNCIENGFMSLRATKIIVESCSFLRSCAKITKSTIVTNAFPFIESLNI